MVRNRARHLAAIFALSLTVPAGVGGQGISAAHPGHNHPHSPHIQRPTHSQIATTASSVASSAASITAVKWFSDKRAAIWVYSPSMKGVIQVQLLLPRDWNYKPSERFATLYMLDGMEARDDQNGWLLHTNVEKFFADKNVIVALPVGGEASFYSDWRGPANGKNYKWETFLTRELPPVLETSWRANQVRGIEGLSMGGTAAMTLAARHPGFYAYAGSFSGILDIAAAGMPLAIQVAMRRLGDFDSKNMYGLPSDPAWVQHDPMSLAPKLRGTALYIASGNGNVTSMDSANAGKRPNPAAMGMEMVSRVSSEQFASRLNDLSIPAVAVYRASGTHSWPYWQFEMQQSWDTAASAMHINNAVVCHIGGAIGRVAQAHHSLGACITPEYAQGNAKAQDFAHGRVIWSPKTGAKVVHGAIAGAYTGAGGAVGDMGVPTSGEIAVGAARAQRFAHGVIVWSPKTGARPIFGAINKKWHSMGGVHSALGLPIGEEIDTANNVGKVQGFEHGAMYYSPGQGTYAVVGRFYDRYAKQQWEKGILGYPCSDYVTLTRHGKMQRFTGGNMYKTHRGVFIVANGPILEAWGKQGYERGKLGYPVGEMKIIPGGSAQQFEHGSITIVNGEVHYV